jgi:hypothetical protein
MQRRLVDIYELQVLEYEQLGIEDFTEIPLVGIEPTSTALAMAIVRFYWRND